MKTKTNLKAGGGCGCGGSEVNILSGNNISVINVGFLVQKSS
jgi:hypothetical protein